MIAAVDSNLRLDGYCPPHRKSYACRQDSMGIYADPPLPVLRKECEGTKTSLKLTILARVGQPRGHTPERPTPDRAVYEIGTLSKIM